MKKFVRLLVVFAFLYPMPGLGQQSNIGSYTIKGNIRGLGNDSVVILISNYKQQDDKSTSDTIIMKSIDGKFSHTANIGSTKMAWMSVGGLNSRNGFSFYVEPGVISVEGHIDSLQQLAVTGTMANNEQRLTRSYTNDIYSRVLPLREQMKTIEKGSTQYNSLEASIAAKFDSIQSYELAYIKAHPDSYVSATFLYVKQDKLPLQELEQLYNRFSAPVKQSFFANSVQQKIKARKLVAIGNKAPGFTSTDTAGQKVSLADFRGKYVLLEFWASWCVPCREQSPHLNALYKKYAGKGFTILQYSMDDKSAAENWKAAIIKDQLVWTQVADLKGFESPVAKMYGVQPIPDNFLIDPNGLIIGRRLEGKKLEAQLAELFH